MATIDHKHSAQKYGRNQDRGRECDECRRLNSLQRKTTRLRQSRGTSNRLITDPHEIDQLRRRYHRLKKRGYTDNAIAQASGITDLSLRKIVRKGHPPAAIRRNTLLGFTRLWESVMDNRAPIEAVRRKDHAPPELSMLAVQGLQLRGWSGEWIGEKIGLSKRSVNCIGRGSVVSVKKSTEDALVQLARDYGTIDGPSSIARKRAERLGFKSTVERDEFL